MYQHAYNVLENRGPGKFYSCDKLQKKNMFIQIWIKAECEGTGTKHQKKKRCQMVFAADTYSSRSLRSQHTQLAISPDKQLWSRDTVTESWWLTGVGQDKVINHFQLLIGTMRHIPNQQQSLKKKPWNERRVSKVDFLVLPSLQTILDRFPGCIKVP